MSIAELKYEKSPIERGYAGNTLYINLSNNEIVIKDVNEEMKEKFIGGKGFDLWLMWNSLPKNKKVKWDDPENELCIASGPLGGAVGRPGGGKSIVTAISPLTGIIIDSNVGGYFGPYLKYSGFDAIEIQGKSEKEIVIFIDGKTGIIKIEPVDNLPENSHELMQLLTKKYADDETESAKVQVAVVSSGPAAKYSKWGCLNFSFYSRHRKWASSKQAGRGGTGSVLRNKNIRALVCKTPKYDAKINNPANLEADRDVSKQHTKEILELDPIQNEMRRVGTGYLPEIMNRFDLLPTENFRFGAHKELKGDDFPYNREVWREIFEDGKGQDACWVGCAISCSHFTRKHVVLTGPYKGQNVNVDGPEYETIAGCGSNWDVWDPKWLLEVNFYCDTYGLDTISVGTGIGFVMECYETGIINKEITGGIELNFGNAEGAMELIHQMARGEGFGVVVGQGIKEMKKVFAEKYGGDPQFLHDIGLEHKGLEFSEYVTKESLAQQGGYGFTLKGPQHDEAWLIFEDMIRKSIPTFEDKAKALCWFPYWRTWFGLNGLCKLPWNDVNPPENKELPTHDPETGELLQAKIMKHVEWYAQYFTAVMGRETTPDDLIAMSERVYNFQRILNIRLGGGLRKGDSNFPYRAMGPVTPLEYESRQDMYDTQLKEDLKVAIDGISVEEKIKILRDHRYQQYEKLQDAVYEARGWTENGCPSIEKVKNLGLDSEDVLNVISKHQ
ncbi:MAG: aldehyde ferredoxin oxidoreductase family protein [Candidatus Hodarchaeota archaeon]